ncbi:hypothetical protein V5799_033867 [Amblyomma americanum]|uniref:Uncharacterized protein n=1 Tax=Amblyomma americanum TaxID=6943 RepID=A0AAQ4DM33_AMBAM
MEELTGRMADSQQYEVVTFTMIKEGAVCSETHRVLEAVDDAVVPSVDWKPDMMFTLSNVVFVNGCGNFASVVLSEEEAFRHQQVAAVFLRKDDLQSVLRCVDEKTCCYCMARSRPVEV